MSSNNEITINAEGLSKCFHIYNRPRDRLKQAIIPKLQKLHGSKPKNYAQEFWALSNVSFQLRKGEAIGIIGRNGAGKSTLLQLLCGTLSPTHGNVEVNGRVAALLELGSGFNPEFSGRENVYMNAMLLGLTKEQVDARFEQIEAFAEIGQFIDQPVKNYSSGMFVRLAFAVVAHVDADVLIIDEALAVGDALFTQKCMRFIRKFRENHTLLFVSHDISSVMNLCDKAIWLEKGELVAYGPSKEVCEKYVNSLLQAQAIDESNSTSILPKERIDRVKANSLQWRDQRSDFINSSNLRNDLEIFKFSPSDKDYSTQDTTITDVKFLDSSGHPLTWSVGGEKVCLRIEVETKRQIPKPIIGFSVKDRLGQSLFGDNTYLSFRENDCSISKNSTFTGEFEFFMPWLPTGDYTIQVAVANGTQENHSQLHWIHDAILFKSHHNPVSTGLIGIPMTDIRLYES
ncbi:ABC transporter ATP-binding protein [Pseudomonas sp. PSE14]|uniref:ABC transporter ATP-binding protein n=1 Tax=Pseudomonas sp. PSE14 TaxID=3016341 RepID=UPI0023D7D3A5|nr:ABC transporter ATP-binding protein [Pseudomonas sp. PSE14]WEJ71899.1 ABC transporter ATP-binding protein [Pseudomonas sp. PSE14]